MIARSPLTLTHLHSSGSCLIVALPLNIIAFYLAFAMLLPVRVFCSVYLVVDVGEYCLSVLVVPYTGVREGVLATACCIVLGVAHVLGPMCVAPRVLVCGSCTPVPWLGRRYVYPDSY